MARGTMAARSFWLMKISDTAVSVVAVRGYSTCQVMGCVREAAEAGYFEVHLHDLAERAAASGREGAKEINGF